METMQIVLATHQRQYLDDCKHHFGDGNIVELNPRSQSRRVSWRPGRRLDRAEEEVNGHWTNAATEMRKYREEVLSTLDAYSPEPFFDHRQLRQSLETYSSLKGPHPLAGPAQKKIAECLNHPDVCCVLDAGSHHKTESNVTHPMARQCLKRLRDVEGAADREVDRLARLSARERQGTSLPTLSEYPIHIPESASWADPISIQVLGRAAAKPESWVCNENADGNGLALPPGSAVAALSGTLEPIVRAGQWLLTAPEDVVVRDGDLVVAIVGKRRLLRRAWTEEANWHLASTNPVLPGNPIVARKSETPIRKVWGVLYEPLMIGTDGDDEWQPRDDFDSAWIASLHTIAVEGESLSPLARRGQHVLVASQQFPAETIIGQGGLAVLETNDDSIGNVIKRVYRRDDQWVLVSPNPVEPPEPILVPAETIVAVWPLRGVLFESTLASEA